MLLVVANHISRAISRVVQDVQSSNLYYVWAVIKRGQQKRKRFRPRKFEKCHIFIVNKQHRMVLYICLRSTPGPVACT